MNTKTIFSSKLCRNCGRNCDCIDKSWKKHCSYCLERPRNIQHYIKDEMTTEQKVNFAINILYDIKYDDIENKHINNAIKDLQKFYK